MEFDMTIFGLSAVAITMAVTQLIKQYINSKWSPISSLIIGVGIVVFASWGYVSPEIIIKGILVGLTSSGLYSGIKSLAGK